MLEREIEFERCFNFRDLGGYAGLGGKRVRWRRLYRSMSPQWMSEADVRRARSELNIGAVIDFRAERSAGSGSLGEPPTCRTVIPVLTSRSLPPETPTERVALLLTERNGPLYVQAIEFIAGQEAACLFHCQTGKDRTGLQAAVLLKLLGVSDADVLEDYMLSSAGFKRALALWRESDVPVPASGLAVEPPEGAWLQAMLDWLETRGGAEAHLLASGASPELLARFREAMLEEAIS